MQQYLNNITEFAKWQEKMDKGQWTSEQQKILDAREVKDPILNSILSYTIRRMEDNPYCRQILENAGYYNATRPDQFDAKGFHLEKIYVGHSNPVSSPSGHCTKESFQYLNKKQENEGKYCGEATRDAVFINECVVKNAIAGALQDMRQDDDIAFSYEDKKLELQKRLTEDADFRERFLQITSSELACYVAHECLHAGQMNQGLNNGAQCSRSLHDMQDIEREKEFFYGRDENGNIREKFGEHSPYQKWFTELAHEGKLIESYGRDSIDEAAVMAPAYIAFLEMKPTKGAISRVNSTMYDKVLLNDHSMKKIMTEFVKSKDNSETKNSNRQQEFCRLIFAELLQGCGKQAMQKARRHEANAGIIRDENLYKIDYNDKKFLNALKYSYRSAFFGDINAYAQVIPNGLNRQSVAFLAQDQNNKTSLSLLNKQKDKER